MNEVFVIVGTDFATNALGVKFALRNDQDGDQLIFGFNVIEDEKITYLPYRSGKVDKVTLNELKKFIDEAIKTIEKIENET